MLSAVGIAEEVAVGPAISRRNLLTGLCTLPFVTAKVMPAWPLPDRPAATFAVDGTYLDCAYEHPMPVATKNAYLDYLQRRITNDDRVGPGNNPRNKAVALFAGLIHADPADIAVVPSTMEGENLVGASLGLGQNRGVVTDALHYDASLVLYGELAKRGMPLTVVAPRGGGISLDDIDAAIGKSTRLVAVSLVSNVTGHQYDLKALCDLAHAKGALVYADIIQAAGAVPLDVKASGVDFCCCGTYKWLMGDFGTAFLYVRPDRLPELKRTQVGWRQVRSQVTHGLPYDPPGPPLGEWTLGSGTAATFEVSTPAWGALACVAESLAYIQSLGVDAIARHRRPLLDHLLAELPKRGFQALTPAGSASPILVFAYQGAAARFNPALKAANIHISTYENRIRISPSLYNDLGDMEKLVRALSS